MFKVIGIKIFSVNFIIKIGVKINFLLPTIHTYFPSQAFYRREKSLLWHLTGIASASYVDAFTDMYNPPKTAGAYLSWHICPSMLYWKSIRTVSQKVMQQMHVNHT